MHNTLLAHLNQREDGEREPPPREDLEGSGCCWQEEGIPDGIVQHLHRARMQSGDVNGAALTSARNTASSSLDEDAACPFCLATRMAPFIAMLDH